jgi:hypothetical protein
MTTETKFRAGIAMSLLGLIIMTFEFFEKDRVLQEYKVVTTKQIDSLTTVSDSLRDEQFMLNVEIGRHEITREEMFTRFPNLEKQYNAYYEHETE